MAITDEPVQDSSYLAKRMNVKRKIHSADKGRHGYLEKNATQGEGAQRSIGDGGMDGHGHGQHLHCRLRSRRDLT